MLNKTLLIIFLFIFTSLGSVLPNKNKTPGNVDPCVTIVWVCNHFTDSSYPLFKNIKAAYRNYGIDINDKRYSLNHLIPMNLGGTNEISNLWPMMNIDFYFKKKIEENIFHCVCYGFITLKEAQYILRTDWTSWKIDSFK